MKEKEIDHYRADFEIDTRIVVEDLFGVQTTSCHCSNASRLKHGIPTHTKSIGINCIGECHFDKFYDGFPITAQAVKASPKFSFMITTARE